MTTETARSDLIKNRKILVVDDHRNIRVSLRMTLEGEGARIFEAEGPFGVVVGSYSTCWPSFSVRSPARSTAEMWTKMSLLPLSGWMKP